MNIGCVIKKYRKELGITQEEMANRLGVTTPAVNKWENGNSKPDIELLSPIARLLLWIPYCLFRKNLQMPKWKKLSGKWIRCFRKRVMIRLMNGPYGLS